MVVYVKAEYKTSKGMTRTMSVSCKAVSSLAGLRKLELHLYKVYGIYAESLESSTRQPYTSLAYIHPLVTINNKGIMQGLPYIHHRPTTLHHIA